MVEEKPFDTPVLLIIFNRPEKVRALISALSAVRPTKVYISADGPRPSVLSDAAKCAEARAVAKGIPWPCDIHTNFSEANLGVDKGMETAMSWFYSHVEEGIICEDDCVPNKDFFFFCRELLEKYRDDRRVMLISGTNFQDGIRRGEASYYFSNYPTWGYSMWKRTWQAFDSSLNGFPDFVQKHKIDRILEDPAQKKFWLGFFRKIWKGKFKFTDTRLAFSIWNAGGVCIIPQVNLVRNIGFDQEATHPTIGEGFSIEQGHLGKIIHPEKIEVDRMADDYFFNKVHRTTFFKKLGVKIGIFLKK